MTLPDRSHLCQHLGKQGSPILDVPCVALLLTLGGGPYAIDVQRSMAAVRGSSFSVRWGFSHIDDLGRIPDLQDQWVLYGLLATSISRVVPLRLLRVRSVDLVPLKGRDEGYVRLMLEAGPWVLDTGHEHIEIPVREDGTPLWTLRTRDANWQVRGTFDMSVWQQTVSEIKDSPQHRGITFLTLLSMQDLRTKSSLRAKADRHIRQFEDRAVLSNRRLVAELLSRLSSNVTVTRRGISIRTGRLYRARFMYYAARIRDLEELETGANLVLNSYCGHCTDQTVAVLSPPLSLTPGVFEVMDHQVATTTLRRRRTLLAYRGQFHEDEPWYPPSIEFLLDLKPRLGTRILALTGGVLSVAALTVGIAARSAAWSSGFLALGATGAAALFAYLLRPES